jgi:hypothetical protein
VTRFGNAGVVGAVDALDALVVREAGGGAAGWFVDVLTEPG